MLRNLLGVVVGYVVMAALVFGGLTALYLGLGADRAFEPGTYQVSMLWIGASMAVGLIAAVLGGLVCRVITRHHAAVQLLAVVVVALGVVMAIPILTAKDSGPPPARTGDVPNLDAMMKARTPLWVALANPVIGAFGVMFGGAARGRAPKRVA